MKNYQNEFLVVSEYFGVQNRKYMKMIYIFVASFIVHWTSCESALRVIGGRDALQDEFPYVVRLEVKKIKDIQEDTIHNYYQFCTGAALTSKWVLSAAHCAEPYDFREMNIRYNSYFPKITGLLAPILEIIIHPGYNLERLISDILLLRSTNIHVSQYGKVNAVDFKSLVGNEAVSLGFGLTNTSSFEKPLQVLKGMLSNCVEGGITSHMICLVRQCNVKATICDGDSGGPIVHSAGIVGVNSMSADDCSEKTKTLILTPGTSASVIAPISPVLDWIRKYCIQ